MKATPYNIGGRTRNDDATLKEISKFLKDDNKKNDILIWRRGGMDISPPRPANKTHCTLLQHVAHVLSLK